MKKSLPCCLLLFLIASPLLAQVPADTCVLLSFTITVYPEPTVAIAGPDRVCAGDTVQLSALSADSLIAYQWSTGDSTPTISIHPGSTTIYGLTVTSAAGCTTVAGDTVQVVTPPQATISGPAATCLGSPATLTADGGTGTTPISFSWNTGDTTASITVNPALTSTYSVTVKSAGGLCTELAQTTLTVHGPSATLLTAASCNPADTGTVVQVLQNQWTCDSTVTTVTSLSPSSMTALSRVTCNPANTGVFTQNLINQYGCDSTVVTTVTFDAGFVDTTLLSATTCDPAGVGTTQTLLTGADGCDSLLLTTTTLLPHDTTMLSAGTCDPAATGVFTQNLLNQYGCDSLVVTTVTLLPHDTTYLSGTSCNPANTGVFNQVLSNQFGCDSLIVTTVSLAPIPDTQLSATTCDPAGAGVFSQTLQTAGGCDSTIITTVTLLPHDTTYLSGTSCNPGNVGVFSQNLVNQYGCDSLVVTTITFALGDTTLLSATTCDPAAAGVFTKNLQTTDGCDSLVVTTITLLPSAQTDLTATTCNPAAAGVFVQNLQTAAGCDSIVTTTVTLVPLDTTYLSGTTCDANAAGVFTQNLVTAGGCDSVVVNTISLLPSYQIDLGSTTCNAGAAGVFVQNLSTAAGCDSVITTTITLVPLDTTFLSGTSCDANAAGVFTQNLVTAGGCDSVVVTTVSLLQTDTTVLNFTTCDAAQVGTSISILSNQLGCDSVVVSVTSLLSPSDCSAALDLAGSTIPCSETTGSLTLTATVGLAPFTYEVLLGGTVVASGTISGTGQATEVSGLAAGDYSVEITASSGYTATAQAQIGQIFPPELSVEALSDFGGYAVSCSGAADGSAKAEASGGTAPYAFSWSNGALSAQVDALAAGDYSVTVSDVDGCTDAASLSLSEPEPLALAFGISPIGCFGDHDGSVVAMATGGVAPLRYVLNGSTTQASNVFPNLGAGTYTIAVLDANDCETSESILINAPPALSVDLGDDQFVDLGDTVLLNAVVNVPFDSLATIAWAPELDSSGLVQSVIPVATTAYSVRVITAAGCEASDQNVVHVNHRRFLYIPNAFSPNDDQVNDGFTVFARPGTVRNIRSLSVFSRWGEMLWIGKDFQPNNPALGWKGDADSKPVNPGVFVWMAEIEFVDGEVEVFSGDVTVVR